MAYSEKTDILKQLDDTTLTQLVKDAAADTAEIMDARVAEAIADADGEIDGYCGKRYAVPFSTVPAIIKKFSVTIAIKNLFARRRGVPDSRRQDYDDAIAFLKGVAAGKNSLGESDPDGVPGEANDVQIEGPDRIFSRDSMEGY